MFACLFAFTISGYISYSTSREALEDSIYGKLAALRTRQAAALTSYTERIAREAKIYSNSLGVRRAFSELKQAYQELNNQSLTFEQTEQLKRFYKKEIFPRLKLVSKGEPIIDAYIPSNPAAQYLQYYYLASNPHQIGTKAELNRAGDESSYSNVHAQIHPRLRKAAEEFGYYDFILVDGESGDIIYTVSKEIDLGTNLQEGLYSNTNLARAYKEALKIRDPNHIVMVDFENYRPSYDRPAAFIATNIFDNNKFLGVLIFQIPIESINQVMTVNQKWQEVGLENTGESFLIGPDLLMRSEPRLFIENPERYFSSLLKAGYSKSQIERIRDLNTPILQQKVKNNITEKVFDGEQGTEISKDFRGATVLSSYQPLEFLDLNWALIAQIEEKEAFDPVNNLNRRIIIAAAVILPLMALIANWFSNLFTRPIEYLLGGTKRLAAGETNVRVKIDGFDEFGQLANSFNVMAQKLHEKEHRLQEQIRQNENLLLNILPPSAVKRVQEGDMYFADSYSDVSLLYVDVEGFNNLTSKVTPQEAVDLLNEMIGAFDEAADKYGIEKLKTIGTTYIAVSGLSIPRVDHAKKAVDFAIELVEIIQKFSQNYSFPITLGIGIHSGSVVGGIVGKSKFIYELWGDAMKITHGIYASPETNSIQVTEQVKNALDKIYHFEKVKDVFIKGIGSIPVWVLKITSQKI
ncbi:adenylate/guanylate cyclase domain-containing protein [Xenococcus sp. PCC 7305]|uniref:adenylate/guanylate cyclase domain-containing protein n=1 Tax=Xenococcus sp. PCC 7305 TaxID=102125 RepID=UPI00130EE150|nr:adenylate/guanylate cyclase domain-containing protein [Xenococcus sp. PCC 7305]